MSVRVEAIVGYLSLYFADISFRILIQQKLC